MDISRRRFIKATSGTLAIGVAAAGAGLQVSAMALYGRKPTNAFA